MNKALSTIFVLAAAAFAGGASAQDAQAGEKKAAMCIGCHGIPGYQASFPEIHKVPMISGQGAKYIVSALTAYKKGERKHPTMRGIAASLSEQDMADLGAFYETNGGPAANAAAAAPTPPAQVAELLTKGNCASCHGENLNKPIDPSYPKLSGQYADYLYVALRAYQTDHNSQVGRANAIMAGMAKPFSHAELKLLAGYLASLPGDLKTVPESRFR
ncbi:c-type cytochrome [Piscinibacter sp.]|uniref:c-type cytochrome n=1 Tax=Piscinibacter sp. TaxID=1903157 RepID=UPI0039E4DB54